MRRSVVSVVAVTAAGLALAVVPTSAASAAPPNFTVNSTGDGADASVGDGVCATTGGACTLRAAIQEANFNADLNTIAFNLATAPVLIRPATALPAIVNPVVIDGTTQPGYADHPVVEVSGLNIGGNVSGIRVTGGGSTIRGLSLTYWGVSFGAIGAGILLGGPGGANTVVGNYIGLTPGAVAEPNTEAGLKILNSDDNVIGGTTAADRNVISGNNHNLYPVYGTGVTIAGTSTGNLLEGNYIGTKPDGVQPQGNGGGGVRVAAPGNYVGTAGAGNLISGNPTGVIVAGSAATANHISGNIVGLDYTGTQPLRNHGAGIAISNASDNIIGGTGPGDGNTVSANGSLVVGSPTTLNSGVGISIGATTGQTASGNRIEGNRLGTDITGTHRQPGYNAVDIEAPGNILGGTVGVTPGGACTGACNQIAGNQSHSVLINTSGTVVEGNQFGLAPDGHYLTNTVGANALGTGGSHIVVYAGGNTIGGTTPAERNVISGANIWGVDIVSGQQNLVEGNYIGTDSSGENAAPNLAGGVLTTAGYTTIGGVRPASSTDCTGPCNVISGNGVKPPPNLANVAEGVEVSGANAIFAAIQGNFIGTDPSGTTAVPNIVEAAVLAETARDGTIGGHDDPGQGNVISGNTATGIALFTRGLGTTTVRWHVEGNRIGVAADGSALGNAAYGVHIAQHSQNNVIGGTVNGAGNEIADNRLDGIEVGQDTGNDNSFRRNSIHDNGSLGIDRAPHDIPNPNDPKDTDFLNFVGLDDLQNWPVVQTASSDGTSQTTVTGFLNSTPGQSFTLEFFACPVCDPSGYGEGQQYLGDTVVTTDTAGDAPYTVTLASGVAPGWVITGTATNAGGNTSEFSQCGPGVVPVSNAADVRIQKSASVSAASSGDPVTYTLTVSNKGPNTAHNVQLVDPLGTGIDLVSVTGEGCQQTTPVTCALGDLAASETATVTVTVDVTLSGTGPWTNTARVSSDTPDPDPTNNASTVTILPPGATDPCATGADRDGDGISDFCDPLHIGDTVWRDDNHDGSRQVGEPGIPGVIVTLDGPNGLHLATSTDSEGHYDFALADPVAGDYTARVDSSNFDTGGVLEDWTATTPSPAQTAAVTVFDSLGFDFGYYLQGGGTHDNCPGVANPDQADRDSDGIGNACDPLLIGDRVWDDANRDTVQDPGETGLPLVSVTLTDPSGHVVGSQTTGTDGSYLFALMNPASGSYTVTVDASNFDAGGSLYGWVPTDTASGNARQRTIGCCDDLTFDLGYAPKPPPVVTAPAPVRGIEGSPIALNASISDVADWPEQIQWSFAPVSGVDAGANCSFTPPDAAVSAITCTDDGVYSATITVGDGINDPVSQSVQVTVDNAAPHLTITAPTDGALYAAPVSLGLTSNYTDAGTNDTHTCTIAWDDGATSTFAGTVTGAGARTCNATHSYSAAGVSTITVTVTDDDGASDTATVMIVVYDPTAGFVTGGGWINSPAGAYRADLSLTGRADFGFVSKYQKGATVPTGQTEFQFQLASFDFHSSSYDWLVVSGKNKAQYKGSGTINGLPGYGFLLTAYDNGSTGDAFRIKIWRLSDSVVVYDNNYGASTDIDKASPTSIAGGQIVIH